MKDQNIKLRNLHVLHALTCSGKLVVYYESLKPELKTKTTYGYRCDERLKTNVKESTRLACTQDVLQRKKKL